MREEGQVFTLDMLFALILVASFVSVSTQAFDIASGKMRSFSTRYSMERTIDDAANVLVESPGSPMDWEYQAKEVNVPGLAVFKENTSSSVSNRINVVKLAWLRELMRAENWDTSRSETQAIMKLFGGTQNFEITVIKDENVFMKFWPGWDEEDSSGVDNSLEVATVERLGYLTSQTANRLATGPLAHSEKNSGDTENFLSWRIYEGGLEVYDWYIYARTSENDERDISKLQIWVNDNDGGWSESKFKWDNPTSDNPENIFPKKKGGLESSGALEPDDNLVVGLDNLKYKFQAEDPGPEGEDDWASISILGAPAGMDFDKVRSLKPGPVKIRVKVWR